MTHRTFTIHTQLIDGTLDGPRNIYMGANRTCHLYVLPRISITLANSIKDIAGNPALYILLGMENGIEKAYIGQTTDLQVVKTIMLKNVIGGQQRSCSYRIIIRFMEMM